MRLTTWVKEAFFPKYSGSLGSFMLGVPRHSIPYSAEVGDGLSSSVVMPAVQWLMRAFPEARPVVQRRDGLEWETLPDHPLAQLLEQPNPYYSGTQLWMTSMLDWCWLGESYWRIMAARGGRPAELWWLPWYSTQPQWPADGSEFISHYTYGIEGQQITLPIEEVVHYRHGLDPRNPRHGLPPLRGILPDIWIDQECVFFVSAILRNMGTPGLILSPKSAETTLSEAEVERVKQYITSRFTGDQRGLPLALGAPTSVEKLSISPADFELSALRNTAEERVSAGLGLPSAVIGYGTGLEQTKVGATMGEMRKLAWLNGVMPVQRSMAAELSRVLLPWYETDLSRFRVTFDYSEVEALAEDKNAMVERLNRMVQGGWMMVSEARTAMGLETSAEDEVYLRSNTFTAVDPADQMPEPEPLPVAVPPGASNGQPANGNANGNGQAVQQRAALKQGTLEEWLTGLIGRHAQRVEQTPRGYEKLANRLLREERKLQPGFQRLILDVLNKYGQMAAVATREIIPKASVADMIRMSIITERVPTAAITFEMRQVYEEIGSQMADMLIRVLSDELNLELTQDARLKAQVAQAMGERVRLLDLHGEARTAILRSLDEATQAGMSEDALIELVRTRVPAGRWTTPEIRAQILARTESRFAANESASRFAEQTGVGKVLILDARLGPTDSVCETRNGFVVTPAEGRALASTEHTNGTLTILPLISTTSDLQQTREQNRGLRVTPSLVTWSAQK